MQTLEKSAPPQPAVTAKQPATIRIAVWSAHHKWLVVVLWFSFTFGLFATGQIMGTKTRTLTNEADVYPALEASKGWHVFNADGSQPVPQSLIVVVSHPSLKTDTPEFKTVVTGLTAKFRQMTYRENGQNLPLFGQIADAYSLPLPILNAKDGSATRLIAIVSGDPAHQVENLKPAVEAIKTLRAENPGFQINYLSQAYFLQELIELMSKDLDSSLIITLPATFIILLVAFGTLAAASVPLVLAMSALLGAFGVLSIYSNLIEPVDFAATA
jgi:putative drug exporter of the RND superfamily